MSTSDIEQAKRTTLRHLERLGLTPETACTKAFDTTQERYEAWLVESLWSCAVSLERGDHKVAFRSIIQVRYYLGRIGGAWPSPAIHDSAAHMQSAVEDLLGGESR